MPVLQGPRTSVVAAVVVRRSRMASLRVGVARDGSSEGRSSDRLASFGWIRVTGRIGILLGNAAQVIVYARCAWCRVVGPPLQLDSGFQSAKSAIVACIPNPVFRLMNSRRPEVPGEFIRRHSVLNRATNYRIYTYIYAEILSQYDPDGATISRLRVKLKKC